MTQRLVPIGYVARAHGLRGELRVHPHQEGTAAIRRGAEVTFRKEGAPDRVTRLVDVRRADRAYLVTVPGVSGRDAAEAWKGFELLVDREALPEPEAEEFYVADLVGARVELVGGDPVGTVRDVLSYPSCDALLVAREGQPDLEVPLVEAYVERVDAAAGLVRLHHVDEL